MLRSVAMTETLVRSGGPNTPDVYMVTCDQVTILGNGTRENPLRAGPGGAGGTLTAAFRGDTPPPVPGMPVVISAVSEPGGVTTVQQTDVRASELQFSAFAGVSGVVTAVNEDGTVEVQTSGIVQLTAAQWDTATGGSGGLTLGSTYYPTAPPGAGVTSTRPSLPGDFVTRVGIAISATQLLLEVAPPVQVLGDSIYFATNVAAPPVVGTVVVGTGTGLQITPAINSGTAADAAAVGVIAAYASGAPVVQSAGIATLTTAQWDAVTGGSGGLTPGTPYYVAGTSGHLTSARPSSPTLIAQVGIAISTTQLLLSTPATPV